MAEPKTYGITLEDEEYIVTVEEMSENEYMVSLNGYYYPVTVRDIQPEPEPEPGPGPELNEDEIIDSGDVTSPTGTESGDSTEESGEIQSDDEDQTVNE